MSQNNTKSFVRTALGSLMGVGLVLFLISGVINLLALTGSFYMLQVYDRVLASRSIPTLVSLSMLAAGLYFFQGALEVIRTQLMVRLGARVDRRLTNMAHEAALMLPLAGRRPSEALQPIRDIDTIRGFLSGQGPIAILDMPWMPLYVAFAFLLHPVLGVLTIAGALVLIALTLITEKLTREPSEAVVKAAGRRFSLADAASRNAEVLRAMGFGHKALRRFTDASRDHAKLQQQLGDLTSGMSATSRIFRLILQSTMLGAGAYLTIQGSMSAGAIIAVSIATSRAYAPIEIAIANWKGFVASRQAAKRVDAIFNSLERKPEQIELPAPKSSLKAEGITITVPGSSRVVVSNVSFELTAGQACAVIGPSAAGKSSLARALVGVWPAVRGSVRIDGAALDHWSPARLGEHVGYLPQDVELFDGTITDNIARFDENPDSKDVIAAARAAGVHDMILRLPDGYETVLGDRGQALSAGQRQRVGLARALYRNPFLVVLDEPNSNLDSEGEEALAKAITSVRERNGIVVVIAHRPGVLAAVDRLAVFANGQLTAFGPRDEVLRKVVRPPQGGSGTAGGGQAGGMPGAGQSGAIGGVGGGAVGGFMGGLGGGGMQANGGSQLLAVPAASTPASA